MRRFSSWSGTAATGRDEHLSITAISRHLENGEHKKKLRDGQVVTNLQIAENHCNPEKQ